MMGNNDDNSNYTCGRLGNAILITDVDRDVLRRAVFCQSATAEKADSRRSTSALNKH
jgi:hypothetical protein